MENIHEIIDHLGVEALEDFAVNVQLELENIEHLIMTIDGGNRSAEVFNSLALSLEYVKSNCRSVFMDPLVAYVQAVERMVEHMYRLHGGAVVELSELILLMVDELRAASEEVHLRHSLDLLLLEDFCQSIKALIAAPVSELKANVVATIARFAHRVHPDVVFSAKEIHLPANAQPGLAQADDCSHDETQQIDEQMEFLEDLALAMDARSQFTEQRTQRLVEISLSINRFLPRDLQEDRSQLLAAVYMHDIGMMFLADSILHKPGKYSSDEMMMLEQHPIHGFRLLSLMPQWRQAALMVRQHHERYDGKGYPNGLSGSEISQGAKILAVADAFFSLTNQRSDRDYKKSVLRALLEINKNNGTQFDPAVVEALNVAVKE